MKTDDPKIESLRAMVKAARQEFDMAVMFHETWKPSVYDKELLMRMGTSYATNAFHVVRIALRREMLLALMRIWDGPKQSVRLGSVANDLRDKRVINALAAAMADRIKMTNAKDEIAKSLHQHAEDARNIIDQYTKDGFQQYAVRKKLKTLRDEHLAHRQVKASAATGADTTESEIESFYKDTSKLIGLLLHLVEGEVYDPGDTADVYRHYAKLFWAPARGEKDDGHPNFRPSPRPLK